MSGETARPAPAWFVQLFAHRRWIRRTEPFPHIYARDVFTAEFYERLRAETARVRAGTADEVSLWSLRDGPLAVFTAREWHDLIAGLTDSPVTGDVTGSLRHHPAGGPAQAPRTGHPRAGRALALLFHLGPGDWRLGDGGETALHPVAGDAAPALVPPLGNSLVLFECTPYTRHRHLGGDREARDSVLMYLHRPHDTEGDEHGRG
ncbi:2OG-Fe(II) oxygenase [Nocardia higoensis]|uniref:2OG-Fe(II) oxygenase n=1 Tax=Nocardia higoensis TaxID=228599 RepID=UPI0003088B49|nr:2OG-Fe(II) oxygenase [Nocardia higoensis]